MKTAALIAELISLALRGSVWIIALYALFYPAPVRELMEHFMTYSALAVAVHLASRWWDAPIDGHKVAQRV